jgi:hypothetical protein
MLITIFEIGAAQRGDDPISIDDLYFSTPAVQNQTVQGKHLGTLSRHSRKRFTFELVQIQVCNN